MLKCLMRMTKTSNVAADKLVGQSRRLFKTVAMTDTWLRNLDQLILA